MVLLIIVFASPINSQQTTIIKPGDFTKIHVSSEIDAELILATESYIEVDFGNISPEQLITVLKDSTLTLRMKTGKYQKDGLKVKIFYKDDLTGIISDGRASIWSEEELFLSDVDMNLNNGGSIRLKIICNHLTAELAQGSILVVGGTVKMMDLKVSTGATFSGFDLLVEDADILANSAGKAKVSVSHYLKGKAISGGWIGYINEPEKIECQVSLKGEIVKTYLDE